MTKQEFIQKFIQLGHELLEQAELEDNPCPRCGQTPIEKFHTDCDWTEPNNKLNGPHNHYQCSCNHCWCPFGEENI